MKYKKIYYILRFIKLYNVIFKITLYIKNSDVIVAVYPVNSIINISFDRDILNSDWKPESKYN